MPASVGFIGLGLMGSAMARRLLSLGYSVVVWNRTASKADPLKELGATVAVSPRDVARMCNEVHVVVADDDACRAVSYGAEGLLAGAREGLVVVNHSTVTPMLSIELYRAFGEKGAAYIEAPVMGSWPEAEKGELRTMVGGDERAYNKVATVLHDLSSDVFYVGPVGTASALKLAMNLLTLNVVLSLAEAISLCEAWGIDPDKLLEFMGRTWMKAIAERYGDRLRAEKFIVRFKLSLAAKDLLYSVAAAAHKGQPLPLTAASAQVYLESAASGFADKDYSRVFHFIRKRCTSGAGL